MLAALAALVLTQSYHWDKTFSPEATASQLPAGCDFLTVGTRRVWTGEARWAAESLFQALASAPRCSMRLADKDADLLAEAEQRPTKSGEGWLVLVQVEPGDPPVATVTVFDEAGAVLVEFRANRGGPLTRRDAPVVTPAPERKLTRQEVSFIPVAPEINGRPLISVGGSAAYYLRSPVPWLTFWADLFLNYELHPPDAQTQAVTADQLLRLDWAVTVGVEVVPLTWQVSPVFFAGGGFGQGEYWLVGTPDFVPTAVQPVGTFGLGLRWQSRLGFVLRVLLRDLVTPAGVDKVEGCDLPSLQGIAAENMPHEPTTFLPIEGCNADYFKNAPARIAAAESLIFAPHSAAANVLMLEVGVGFAF